MSIDTAIGYATKYGFSVVPQQIKGERKGLVKFKGRDLREPGEIAEVFGSVGPHNVAAKAGEESGGLAEVDIDQRECLTWAPSFLPDCSGWNWGRAGNPGSHWAYLCDGNPQLELKNPLADGDKPTIVEIRGARNKLITLPPAVHGGSGEAVEFTGRPDAAGPPTVEASALVRKCKLFAAAWLLWKYAPANGAHDYAFTWGGASRTSGLTDDEAEVVARAFLTRFDTNRFEDHINTVKDGRSNDSKRLVGWTALANQWQVNRAERSRLLKKLREWLDERKSESDLAAPRIVVSDNGQFYVGPADGEHFTDTCTHHTLQTLLCQDYQGAYDALGDFSVSRIKQVAKKANRVKYSYVVPETTYTLEDKTLVVGVGVDTKLVPGYDSDVQVWLNTLAGSKELAKRLSEWIAATRPDRLLSACPALCVIGDPSVGKSVLASAVSRCWGLEEALPGNLLVARFNGTLNRCPIVLCDENLPKGLDGDTFRTRVTSAVQTVEKKGQERTTIDGCLRIMLAANSDKILNLGPHGLADAQAISARILRIDVPPEHTEACIRAADPLRQSGRRDRLDLAKIAEHFMWMWENIPLTTKSDRWIVEPCSNALQTVLEGHAGAHEELWDHIEAEVRKQVEPEEPSSRFGAGAPNGGVYVRPEGIVIVPTEISEHLSGSQTKDLRNAIRPFTKDRRFVFKLDGRCVNGWLLNTKLLPSAIGMVCKTR